MHLGKFQEPMGRTKSTSFRVRAAVTEFGATLSGNGHSFVELSSHPASQLEVGTKSVPSINLANTILCARDSLRACPAQLAPLA